MAAPVDAKRVKLLTGAAPTDIQGIFLGPSVPGSVPERQAVPDAASSAPSQASAGSYAGVPAPAPAAATASAPSPAPASAPYHAAAAPVHVPARPAAPAFAATAGPIAYGSASSPAYTRSATGAPVAIIDSDRLLEPSDVRRMLTTAAPELRDINLNVAKMVKACGIVFAKELIQESQRVRAQWNHVGPVTASHMREALRRLRAARTIFPYNHSGFTSIP